MVLARGFQIRYWLYPETTPGQHTATIFAVSDRGKRRHFLLRYALAESDPDSRPVDALCVVPDQVDFRETRYDESRDFGLRLENTGDRAIAVRNVSVECGCLSIVESYKGEIKPGDQVTVECRLDGRKLYAGPFRRHVSIELWGGEVKKIPVFGKLVPPYSVEPREIYAGCVPAHTSVQAEAVIRPAEGECLSELRWSVDRTDIVQVQEVDRTDELLRLAVSFRAPGDASQVIARLVFQKVDGSWKEPLPIFATVESGIRVTHRFWNFGTLSGETPQTMRQRVATPDGGDLTVVAAPESPWSVDLIRVASETGLDGETRTTGYEMAVAFDPREATKTVHYDPIRLQWVDEHGANRQTTELWVMGRSLKPLGSGNESNRALTGTVNTGK